jgi:hypothetical protein
MKSPHAVRAIRPPDQKLRWILSRPAKPLVLATHGLIPA